MKGSGSSISKLVIFCFLSLVKMLKTNLVLLFNFAFIFELKTLLLFICISPFIFDK